LIIVLACRSSRAACNSVPQISSFTCAPAVDAYIIIVIVIVTVVIAVIVNIGSFLFEIIAIVRSLKTNIESRNWG
jgi:hypothetical protein